MEISEGIDGMHGLGIASYSNWSDYAWKNELAIQRDRVLQHLEEILQDVDTEYDSHHMLERSISLTAFCMRRLIECRLLTDAFCRKSLPIHEISAKSKERANTRVQFFYLSGGNLFSNFDLKIRNKTCLKPKRISDSILHAKTIIVLQNSAYLPDGLIVASDYQMKNSLFHLTPQEISSLVKKFLDDTVREAKDWIDIETGKIRAIRN